MFEHKPEFLKRSDIFDKIKDVRQVKILEPVTKTTYNTQKTKEPVNIEFKKVNTHKEMIVEKTQELISGNEFRFDGDDIYWVNSNSNY